MGKDNQIMIEFVNIYIILKIALTLIYIIHKTKFYLDETLRLKMIII